MDSKSTHMNRVLRLGLIVLALYFSQVYPYVHFHHAHADHDAPVDLCTQPFEAEPFHSHHGHGHDDSSHESGDNHHHHQDFEQHVDWHLIRTHSSSILSHIEFAYISVQFDTDPTQISSPRYCRTASVPLPDSAVPDGIDPRGPPALG